MKKLIVMVALAAGCGSSSSNDASLADTLSSMDESIPDAPNDAAQNDAQVLDAPPGDAPPGDEPLGDTLPGDAPAGDGSPGTQPLTVKNYFSWCSVTVNGGTPSSAAQQVVNVAPAAIPLVAQALVGFQLGAAPWHDTDGDGGSGDTGTRAGSGQSETSSTTATVGTSPRCVWVCCEFSTGGGCPATDQCP